MCLIVSIYSGINSISLHPPPSPSTPSALNMIKASLLCILHNLPNTNAVFQPFAVTVKPQFIEKFTSFLTGRAGSKPQNAVKRGKFKTKAGIYCFIKQARHKCRHCFPFVSYASQWFISHTQCLFGTKQEIGHWGHFFQPMPAWFTEAKHA